MKPAPGSPRRPRRALVAFTACSLVAGTGLAQRITPAVPEAARPLPLSAVRLTGGPLKRAQDLDALYLLALEPDRMLALYRRRAGLAPRAEPYGGWDGDGRNLTGHIAGHYLSAVSLMWAATGDPRFKQRADSVVKELKEVQDKQGDGFAGALAKVKEAFAEVSAGNIRSASFDLNGLWSPWYTLHKTFAGLRDAYRHTGNRTALEVEVEFAKWAERVVAPLDDAQTQKMLGTEFGGMNEVLADLYADTGDERWLALSHKFEHRAVLDPLKRRQDALDGLHGNTQVPKLLGSLSRYRYAGEPADHVAAEFFWDRVTQHHSFATGGHGKDEYFREADGLSPIVDGRTAETCNVYNMLKLTRALFAIQPAVEYAEFHERALFNHILGSIDPADGATCYMVPVGRSARREYQDMSRDFTCCVGSGMESHALHGDGIYYEAGDRFWVNLYVPSTVDWQAAGVRLDVDTTFPEGESASLRLTLRAPRSFTLLVRRPSWAGSGFAVSVNGQPVKDLPPPASYVELTRVWTSGDSVTVSLPKALRLEPLADNPRRAAILWGPLVLAGDLGPQPARRKDEEETAQARPEIRSLVTAGRPIGEWLKPTGNEPGRFRTQGVGRPADVELVPFYRLHRRTYAAYWDLLTPPEHDALVAERAAEEARRRALEAASVGFVQPGGPEAEKKLNQQGEQTSVILGDEGRRGRRATKWFSYDLPLTAEPSALVVTYNSDNRRPRSFEILIDGRRVGEQRIDQGSVARFFDVEYPLPPELVRGKRKLTVRFQATAGNEVAAVFGIRAIRSQREPPVEPVPFTAVHLDDAFWASRIETNRSVTIPFAFEQCERTGRVELFERAAKALRGTLDDRKPPPYPFDDSDLYKVIEGASYTLSVHPDAKLEAYVDGLIAKIAAAQEPDGYLYTTRTIDPRNPHAWAGKERWELERDDSHELYNLGHLYEAAVAHHLATGKRSLLDVAIKSADLLVATFGPGKRSIWPGHQITEMALARLFRVTGNERYLALAKFLLDERGPNPGEKVNPRGLTYNQAHQKVIEQTEPVGHAVRATYMYSGMADVAALTGDAAYVRAIDTIWENTVRRKLYVTGGIGASGAGEAFGRPYELPNMTAYNETCASVGLDYWNHRLFLLHADAKYIDVMERTLFNGLISGVALDGRTFFYPNPLESNGQHERRPWFGVACCPSNVTRFLASLPGYVYARQGDAIHVNLYAAGRAEIDLGAGRSVTIRQATRYPWDGGVTLTIDPGLPRRFAIKLRIPGWARNEPVPSDLYRFLDAVADTAEVSVNGAAVPLTLERGYVNLEREWRAGDTIALKLPMPVRRVVAHDSVEADRGRVALQRGPIVFAAEWPDNPKERVRNLVLSDATPLFPEFRKDLLGGVQVLKGRAMALAYDEQGNVTKLEQDFTAIPYHAWSNRGPGQMIVWIPRTEAAGRPAPHPTLATTAGVATSGRKSPRLINDGEEPTSSADPTSSFDWWPARGSAEWAEMTFAEPATVSEAAIYWFDDSGSGGRVRVPSSWRLLHRQGTEWRPVEVLSAPGVAKDAWNKITFQPVTTRALRLEVALQPEWSAGIQEWTVTSETRQR